MIMLFLLLAGMFMYYWVNDHNYNGYWPSGPILRFVCFAFFVVFVSILYYSVVVVVVAGHQQTTQQNNKEIIKKTNNKRQINKTNKQTCKQTHKHTKNSSENWARACGQLGVLFLSFLLFPTARSSPLPAFFGIRFLL